MRVLHLYAGNLYGGIERILVTLAREGAAEMEQQFALCFEGRLSEELRALRAPTHILGAVRLSRPWTGWRARKRLLALVKCQGVDIVVVHAAWVWAVFGKAIKSAGIKTALWVHTPLSQQEPIDRLAMKTHPDLIIAVSKDTGKTVTSLFPRVPVEVLYTPLPAVQVSQGDREKVRREMGVAPDQVVIAQVSRMEAWKGHRVHLEALARLKHLSSWTCWMIGGAQRPAEKEYLESLQKRATELGIIDRVRFLGERRDVPVLLSAADIFCQPNLGPEGLGIVFVEAMGSQLPVITTAIGAAPEVVDDRCGRLVAPDDVDALQSTLHSLIADPALRQKLGQNGPARARELCDAPTQMIKLHGILSSLVAEERRSPARDYRSKSEPSEPLTPK